MTNAPAQSLGHQKELKILHVQYTNNPRNAADLAFPFLRSLTENTVMCS